MEPQLASRSLVRHTSTSASASVEVELPMWSPGRLPLPSSRAPEGGSRVVDAFAKLDARFSRSQTSGFSFLNSSSRASCRPWRPNSRRSRCSRLTSSAALLEEPTVCGVSWSEDFEVVDDRTLPVGVRLMSKAMVLVIVVMTVSVIAAKPACLGLQVSAATAAWTQVAVHNDHSLRVAHFAFANFIIPLGDGISDLAACADNQKCFLVILMLVVCPAFFTTTGLIMQMTRDCVADVSAALEVQTARLLKFCMRIFYIGCFAFLCCISLERLAEVDLPIWFVGIVCWIGISGWVLWFVLAMLILHSGAVLALEAAKQGSTRQADECLLAAKRIRYSIFGFSLGVFTSFVHGSVPALRQGVLWPVPKLPISRGTLAESVIALADCFGNALAAGYMSGIYTGTFAGSRTRVAKEQARRRVWTDAASRAKSSSGELWQEKVRELSLRGFSLKALLDFYRGLGTQYMEHFEADRHRTVDVVRHAVIPLSATSSSALASVMMKDEPTKPQKMVTHNWGNLFRDLVAAIIADALEEEEYNRISELLEARDIDRLEGWCQSVGKLDTAYWVCAFSVNQHCTICDQNPYATCDTVTGELYPLCTCGLPKVSNTSQPTNEHGESIQCEVNKFDDMMRLLSTSDPTFEQVVAIDFEFDLFSRAWCVAELAAASEMGMPQKLKFSSEDRLNEKEGDLRKLKIQHMQASRPEDKALILGKIENVHAFNAQLQRLLFEDLLPAWGDLDTVEQIHRLARIARWQNLERERAFTDKSSQTSALSYMVNITSALRRTPASSR